MSTAALVHEKVWFNKSLYDKAESLYHEKLAKFAIILGKMSTAALVHEKVWFNKSLYDKAESLYHKKLAKGKQPSTCSISSAGGSLANEVAKARQHIIQSLKFIDNTECIIKTNDQCASSNTDKGPQDIGNIVEDVKKILKKLEVGDTSKKLENKPATNTTNNDDDVDLFGSDSEGENEESTRIRDERLAAYAAKKLKKPGPIAKSNIIFDVKPWDDETDMKAMEAEVRKIQKDGLLWGAAKLAPVAYNIKKLQISSVVEDDKVSVDWLTEQIENIESYVQSVDIAAFNKI